VKVVASRRARTNRAAALHRQAAAIAASAATTLDAVSQEPIQADQTEQRELAKHLRALVPKLAPGWLGASLGSLDEQVEGTGQHRPTFVRIGTAQPADRSTARSADSSTAWPADDGTFPVIVPLLGTGHLAFDADARDPRVAAALRALLLRLAAATPPGSLLVRVVDGVTGTTFAAFSPLAEAGLMPPPVTDHDGLRTVLAEAEGWVRPERSPSRSTRNRTLLLVVASLPQLTEAGDLHRLAALAQAGPAAGLHLVVAGWPPPPLSVQTAQQPLPLSTQVWLRNPYALVGDPPGASFGESTNGLSCPVYLDEDPPAGVVVAVCREIARQAAANHGLTLGDVLPDPTEDIWGSTSGEGLATTVGIAGDLPVMLRFNDQTPHWMVGGRSGSGKTAFLINVLYGLSMRYGPDELALYLLDFKEGVSFADFTPSRRDPSWLPQARAVGVESDREYGLAVLRELDAEMNRRAQAYKAAGVTRFVDLRDGGHAHLPRVLCVIDEFQVLLAGTDRIATEGVGLLESVARKGRSYGIHLILCSQTVRGVESLYAKRDSIFGQFPVRIALPGGSDVLEPTNYSAAALPLGTAVVNTAGGLGGPRGATRGHEKLVQFPDPHADQAMLSELRLELWHRRPIEADPPIVFEGYAHQYLADDPVFQSLKPGGERREMLVGRAIDVRLSTVTFPVDTTPGRHLAVLGPSEMGADLVDAAARSLATQHEPGTVSFLVASLVVAANPVARRLVADLRAAGHPTTTTDAARLAEDLDPTRPGYLVAFGMEAAGGPPYDRFRALVRNGPTHGAHLIGWWRGLSRFTEQTGGSAGREDVAGLVFLNLPPGDVDLLVGQPMQWRPRPNRALCYDRHTGRITVIVPFARAVS
jgi:DNA segregation ATPase FtsK/SpoIIIE, S-DNA-T family